MPQSYNRHSLSDCDHEHDPHEKRKTSSRHAPEQLTDLFETRWVTYPMTPHLRGRLTSALPGESTAPLDMVLLLHLSSGESNCRQLSHIIQYHHP